MTVFCTFRGLASQPDQQELGGARFEHKWRYQWLFLSLFFLIDLPNHAVFFSLVPHLVIDISWVSLRVQCFKILTHSLFICEIGQFFGYKVSDPNGQVVGCLPDLVRGYRYGHTAHRIVMMGRYSNSEKCISLIAHSDEGFRQTVKTQNTKKDNQKEKREARVENVGVGSSMIGVSQERLTKEKKNKSAQSVDGQSGYDDRIYYETNINYKRKKETKLSQWRGDSERGFWTQDYGREEKMTVYQTSNRRCVRQMDCGWSRSGGCRGGSSRSRWWDGWARHDDNVRGGWKGLGKLPGRMSCFYSSNPQQLPAGAFVLIRKLSSPGPSTTRRGRGPRPAGVPLQVIQIRRQPVYIHTRRLSTRVDGRRLRGAAKSIPGLSRVTTCALHSHNSEILLIFIHPYLFVLPVSTLHSFVFFFYGCRLTYFFFFAFIRIIIIIIIININIFFFIFISISIPFFTFILFYFILLYFILSFLFDGHPRPRVHRLINWTRNSWDRYDGAKLHFSRIHIVINSIDNEDSYQATLRGNHLRRKPRSEGLIVIVRLPRFRDGSSAMEQDVIIGSEAGAAHCIYSASRELFPRHSTTGGGEKCQCKRYRKEGGPSSRWMAVHSLRLKNFLQSFWSNLGGRGRSGGDRGGSSRWWNGWGALLAPGMMIIYEGVGKDWGGRKGEVVVLEQKSESCQGGCATIFIVATLSSCPRAPLFSFGDSAHRGRRPLVEAEARGRLGRPAVIHQLLVMSTVVTLLRVTCLERKRDWNPFSHSTIILSHSLNKHTRRFLIFFYTRLPSACVSLSLDSYHPSDQVNIEVKRKENNYHKEFNEIELRQLNKKIEIEEYERRSYVVFEVKLMREFDREVCGVRESRNKFEIESSNDSHERKQLHNQKQYKSNGSHKRIVTARKLNNMFTQLSIMHGGTFPLLRHLLLSQFLSTYPIKRFIDIGGLPIALDPPSRSKSSPNFSRFFFFCKSICTSVL
ncbi:hypothetical protein VP01_2850g1 [Puccinia sorghi]|uniref:Uncharacterized protein n=1 Tax=Puccinia sorghi TaxID=27349 RepID=A0A0L6V229_9BASI|nr:hypothetical protein VP01_2850g1 [Puccinia sorghi]